MAPKSRSESESLVRSWGFSHVFTWTDGPYIPLLCTLQLSSIYKILPSSLSLPTPVLIFRTLLISCRNAYYPPHSHSKLTTHLIRRGSLTITYPKDVAAGKETFNVGARVDVDAGRVHEVWMGREGCEYVIGEM